MKQALILLLFILHTLGPQAQTVQWASKVITYSSQYGEQQFSAQQVLGKPNVLPIFVESPCAWSPEKAQRETLEYIQVGFDQPMQVQQVAIAENFNAGAVVKVELIDTRGKFHTILENPKPALPDDLGQMNLIRVPLTDYKVQSVKIYLDTRLVESWNHIDAIGISDGDAPILAEINLIKDITWEAAPENLGPNINSMHDEIMPIISGDGKSLFFDRKDHPDNTAGIVNDDVWIARLNSEGHWGPANNVGPPINNKGHNFLCATSFDGKTALLGNAYEPDGSMKSGLSMAHSIGETWSMPKNLLIDDFYNNNKFSEFTMSHDCKVIVMTIQRKGSLGAKDLYVSFGDSLSNYSVPMNLGSEINSAGSEMSPFLAADNKTLYFASDGFSGYGNKDVFMSRRLDETWTHWTEPVNLGPVINSKKWDAYFSVPADGEFAYFCSEKDAIGKTDIYRVKLPEGLRPEATKK